MLRVVVQRVVVVVVVGVSGGGSLSATQPPSLPLAGWRLPWRQARPPVAGHMATRRKWQTMKEASLMYVGWCVAPINGCLLVSLSILGMARACRSGDAS
jgi:hypothetical protein